jgi:hypothetical protein
VEVLSTRTETTVIKELDRNLSINIHDLIVVKQINIQLGLETGIDTAV